SRRASSDSDSLPPARPEYCALDQPQFSRHRFTPRIRPGVHEKNVARADTADAGASQFCTKQGEDVTALVNDPATIGVAVKIAHSCFSHAAFLLERIRIDAERNRCNPASGASSAGSEGAGGAAKGATALRKAALWASSRRRRASRVRLR